MKNDNKKSENLFKPVVATIRKILSKPTGLVLLGPLVSFSVMAAPQNGTVVDGAISIGTAKKATNTIVVKQTSEKGIINWQSFSIDASESVYFSQPNRTSVTLNRVTGADPSSILGRMSANGQVFLVNPNGVYFGPGATLDIHGLVASTLDIRDSDFLSGEYVFKKRHGAPAAGVVNEGKIQAQGGGYVFLAGDYVSNTGLIEARLGNIVLASGSKMTLDLNGDGLLGFVVNDPTLSEYAGTSNSGVLMADGGRVIMTAKTANDLVSTAVNNSGMIQAQGIEEHNGAIFLVGYGGDVINEGSLDVQGISMDGGNVVMRSTQDVILAENSSILAKGDAETDSQGGSVYLQAKNALQTNENSLVDATGGLSGGSILMRGDAGLSLRGNVDLGVGGDLFITSTQISLQDDSVTNEQNISLSSVGSGFIEGQLADGANVYLVAKTEIGMNGAPFSINGINDVGDGGALLLGIGSVIRKQGAEVGSIGVDPYLITDHVIYIAGADGGIDIDGVDVSVDGDLTINAGSASGNISTSSLSTNSSLLITATGGAVNTKGMLDANAIGIVAANDMTISGGFNVGDGMLPGFEGSSTGGSLTLADYLAQLSITDGGSAFPNVSFISGGTLTLDVSQQTDGYRYLFLQADMLNLTGVSAAPGLLVQMTPYSNSSSISLEGSAPGAAVTNYTVQSHLDAFSGTTFVLGNNNNAPITIGTNGAFNIGTRNLILFTQGAVSGLGNVTGSGIIGQYPFAATIASPPVILPPTLLTPPELPPVLTPSVTAQLVNRQVYITEIVTEENRNNTDYSGYPFNLGAFGGSERFIDIENKGVNDNTSVRCTL